MYMLHKDEIPRLLALWGADARVYAPHCDPSVEPEGTGGVAAALSPRADTMARLVPYDAAAPESLCYDYVNFTMPAPDLGGPAVLFNWERHEKSYRAADGAEACGTAVFFGIRPCDVAALRVQDAFYLSEYSDPFYAARREACVIVSLNCGRAGRYCFCSATGSGPFVAEGADIQATMDGERCIFEAGSPRGLALLHRAAHLFSPVDAAIWLARKQELLAAAEASFTCTPDLDDLPHVLGASHSHPLWEEAARRCINCTGCTSACPTCTCFHVVEEQDAAADGGVRVRYKDSCQTEGFTRNAGWHNPRGNAVRLSYRIMDKLMYVADRFGRKGCVGCGRCIAVCPSSIDMLQLVGRLKTEWLDKGSPKLLKMSPPRYEKIPLTLDASVYTPRVAVITEIKQDTRDIKRYYLRYKDAPPDEAFILRGQFYMLTVFGVGEIAVSIPFGDAPGTRLEFCVKEAGTVTRALAGLAVGDEVGLRGPYGRGFPYDMLKNRDLLIVGSGVGMAPVRTVIVRVMRELEAFKHVTIIASARSYSGVPYADDLREWSAVPGVDVRYALSQPTDKVPAHVGYINDLLPGLPFAWPEAMALLCASPSRIKKLAADLLALGMKPEHIYTSLETHMRCGVGKCGHCKVGPYYMCTDGPVFTYKEMMDLPPGF